MHDFSGACCYEQRGRIPIACAARVDRISERNSVSMPSFELGHSFEDYYIGSKDIKVNEEKCKPVTSESE